jgi:hypothetical protein
MKCISFEITDTKKIPVKVVITTTMEDLRFLDRNFHKCPGNSWFTEKLKELIEKVDKEIFTVESYTEEE